MENLKASDLRINNIVYLTKDNFNSVKEYTLTAFDIYKLDDNECADVKGIKLDEEWLLKCKSNSIFNNGFEYKKTSTGRFEVYVGISIITVLEYLHELQNLNFAILGEDVIFDD